MQALLHLCISQYKYWAVWCVGIIRGVPSALRKAKLRQFWLPLLSLSAGTAWPPSCSDLPAAGSVIAILFLCAKNASR